MPALKGFFDDSGDERSSAFCFAGYLATVESWTWFECNWKIMLREHGVPYIHMREFCRPSSPLGHLSEPASISLLKYAFRLILEAKLTGFGSVVRRDDLIRFNKDRGRALRIIPLAIYACLNSIYCAHPGDNIVGVIDRMQKAETHIAKASEYADTHWSDNVYSQCTLAPLKEGLSFRDVLPMQAADLVAWHANKYNRDRSLSFSEPPPTRRLDFEALLNAAPLTGPVLDYDTICWFDDVRRGIWEYKKG